jgi:hypothetical protein
MRLIDKDILAYDNAIDPDGIAPLSIAVNAIHALAQRGYID